MTRTPLLVAGAATAVIVIAELLAPAALSYDPEAWLVWGGELSRGALDVTAGPALKPLPMLVDAGLIATVGTDAASQVWSLLSRIALIGAVVAAVALVLDRTGRRAAAALAGAAVLATPTMLAGALEGASEPAVLLAMLVAARLAAAGRLPASASVLALAGLLRPEALVLGAAVLVVALTRWRRHTGARRAALGVAAAPIMLAPVLWLVLQDVGGGTTADAVGAATALRAGQPGLSDRPAIAALRSALVALPWLVLLAIAVEAARLDGRRVRLGPPPLPRSAHPSSRGDVLSWLAVFATLWLLTVVGMSEMGFSGETRYLAPGIAVGAVAIVGWCALGPASAPRTTAPRRAIAGLIATTAVVLIAVPAVTAQRDRARAQADLAHLLEVVSAEELARCDALAVPRFLRPAVALRTGRPISSIQSPELDGTTCALQRDLRARPGPGGAPRRLVARSGTWTWWSAPR